MTTYYRMEAEASALRMTALEWIFDLVQQLPPDRFAFDLDTLFVGRTVPEEVGCVAVTLLGLPGSLTALEFVLGEAPDAYVDVLRRYRERLEDDRDDA